MVISLIFTNYRSFKIGAVVSGQHCFGYCSLSDMCAGSYILDDRTNSEQGCGSLVIQASLTTAASRRRLWLVE